MTERITWRAHGSNQRIRQTESIKVNRHNSLRQPGRRTHPPQNLKRHRHCLLRETHSRSQPLDWIAREARKGRQNRTIIKGHYTAQRAGESECTGRLEVHSEGERQRRPPRTPTKTRRPQSLNRIRRRTLSRKLDQDSRQRKTPLSQRPERSHSRTQRAASQQTYHPPHTGSTQRRMLKVITGQHCQKLEGPPGSLQGRGNRRNRIARRPSHRGNQPRER